MSRNDAESWVPWHEEEESSFKLDSPPAAISRSLWDEIPTDDPTSMFTSTPAADITNVMLSSFGHQQQQQQQQQHHPDVFECSDEEEDCPVQKRRRMLLFNQEQANPSWYMNAAEAGADDSFTSFQAGHSQESWMTSWFGCDLDDKRGTQAPDSDRSTASVAQAPPAQRTPRSGSRSTGRKSQPNTPTTTTTTPRPVAYPFALLKPCGATGDVTLSDINQRIQTPRPRQIRRLNVEPQTSATTSDGATAAGLSGKSVVALTKIHTEGNGSITIMRTKG